MGIRILLVLAAVAALAACSNGGGDPALREDLQAQADAQQSLRNRVEELESEMAELVPGVRAAGTVGETVTQLEEKVGALEDKLATLESGLQENAAAREASVAELRNSLEELRSSVSNLDGALEKVQRDLADLISRVNLLEERYESHERHPPG